MPLRDATVLEELFHFLFFSSQHSDVCSSLQVKWKIGPALKRQAFVIQNTIELCPYTIRPEQQWIAGAH